MDPKLARYAKGDFPNAGKCLFWQGFMKEVVSQVEADTAIHKALALVSKASRELQTICLQSQLFFHEGRTGGYGARLGRNVFNPYNRKSFQGRGSFRQDRHQSVFSRLGPQQSPTETNQILKVKSYPSSQNFIAGNNQHHLATSMVTAVSGQLDMPGSYRVFNPELSIQHTGPTYHRTKEEEEALIRRLQSWLQRSKSYTYNNDTN